MFRTPKGLGRVKDYSPTQRSVHPSPPRAVAGFTCKTDLHRGLEVLLVPGCTLLKC